MINKVLFLLSAHVGCFALNLLKSEMIPYFRVSYMSLFFRPLQKTKLIFALALFSFFIQPILVKADWRKDIGVFRIGILTDETSAESLDKLAPFKLALSEALDLEVDFFRSKSTVTLIDALASDRIEYAIFSSSAYALAFVACECVEPIAIPRSRDSTDGYHAILVAAPDGPQRLESIIGQKIGILSDNSVMGKDFAKYVLGQQGVILGDETTPFVKKDKAENMLKAFANGEIKTMIGWSSMTGDPSAGYSRGNLRQLVNLFGANVGNYKILWKSNQIPNRPHIVRKKLHGEAKQILRDTLRAMNEKDPIAYDAIEPVYGGGFVAGRHDRFEEIISFMQAQSNETKTAEDELPPQ